MTLSKEQISAAVDLKTQEIDVPEWGGSIYISELRGTDRDAIQSVLFNSDGTRKDIIEAIPVMKLHMLSHTIVDEKGARIFTDIDVLATKNGNVIERLFRIAESMNAIIGEVDTGKN